MTAFSLESIQAILSDHWLITWYVLGINFLALFIYGVDKVLARSHAWRISERTLLLLALCGGSAGALCGIHLFRHKSRKSIFLLYFSIILLLQIGLVTMLLSRSYPLLDNGILNPV